VREATSFVIAANGFADGPAQALRDYLVPRGAEVVTIFHPLTREQGNRHVISTYRDGARAGESSVLIPLRPPASYALDPFVPLLPRRADVWFGFNPLACGRGLVARRMGRASTCVLWSVDFVPDRFGPGSLLTRFYDRLDRTCCERADARVELTESARAGRNRRHGLSEDAKPTYVVPMGAWLDRVLTTPDHGYQSRRIVFLGHLVPRQGVDALLRAVRILRDRGEEVGADIVGSGPLESQLRAQAHELGLDAIVRFHGFVPDHREVERILAGGAVAAAPYRATDETFTRYADPGKLKAYLAAGLPIVLTDVPPNAQELARIAGAEVAEDDPAALANSISHVFSSPAAWQERRERALAYARRFDWPVLLRDLLAKLDLAVSGTPSGQPVDESEEVRNLARDDGRRLEDADRERAKPERRVQAADDERGGAHEHEDEADRPQAAAREEEREAGESGQGREE
jgi:glycosyltransferase involved in cell wall biosynthesis